MKSLAQISLLALTLAISGADARASTVTYNIGGDIQVPTLGASTLSFELLTNVSIAPGTWLYLGVTYDAMIDTRLAGGARISEYFGVASFFGAANNATSVSSGLQSLTLTPDVGMIYFRRSAFEMDSGTATLPVMSFGGCCADTSLVVTYPDNPPVLATPLPAALPLFMAGLGVLGWFARKKRVS